MELARLLHRQSLHRLLFSFCFSTLLLLTTLLPPVSTTTFLSKDGFHPSQILSTGTSSNSGGVSAAEKNSKFVEVAQPEEVREDEVLSQLSRAGLGKRDYRKASTTFMVHLFNDLQRGVQLHKGRKPKAVTDTVRSFSGKNFKVSKKGAQIVKFNIPFLPVHERLKSAEIRFLRRGNVKPRSRKYSFRIDIKKDGKLAGKFTLREKAVSQYQYEVFDVTKLLDTWISSYHGNISLNIRVSRKLQKHSLSKLEDSSLHSTSLIVLYLEDHEFLKNMYQSFTSMDSSSDTAVLPRRSRRSVLDYNPVRGYSSNSTFPPPGAFTEILSRRVKREPKRRKRRNRRTRKWFRQGRKENCQLYDFEVDFNLIGWGQWIIHPKRFNSRFCLGQCPSPIDTKYRPTNHAMLQTLMRMKKPSSAPSPCCVPTKLSALSMLYIEYDEIVVRHHEEMVATECGCR